MRQTVTENRLFSKKDLRKLIIPLILEQTLAITVGMADTMMISSAGEAVLVLGEERKPAGQPDS